MSGAQASSLPVRRLLACENRSLEGRGPAAWKAALHRRLN